MSDQPGYTEYHPRWYRVRLSTWWWMKRPSYFLFILREISSIFVAWFVVYLLLMINAVVGGEKSYEAFRLWAGHPCVVVLNLVSLCLIVFHAVTWFNLAPQALVMRFKGKRVPATWIAASNYAAWALVSLILALWLLLE